MRIIFSHFHKFNILKQFQRYNHSWKYVLKMDKAYLRRFDDTDKFQFTLLLKSPEYNLERQFNFNRRLSENLDFFLSRVNNNVATIVNKKQKRKKLKKKEEFVEISVVSELYENNELVSSDAICEKVFQEKSNTILKILNLEYHVIVNSPYIDNIALPTTMMANCPVYCAKFETVFTDVKCSDFDWHISQDKVKWDHVAKGVVFTPGNKHIGSFLKLNCVPRNSQSEGPAVDIISDVAITAGPGFCPFETRHAFTKTSCLPNEVRVITYNILADLYCDSDYTRTVLHPYCPPYALAIDYRKQLIVKELLGYNADIIFLQEVDRKVYNNDLQLILSNYDFDSSFMLKGGEVAEGLACFYNNKKYKLIESQGIIFAEHLKSEPAFAEIWKNVSSNEKLSERILDKKTAIQILVVECLVNNKIILLANTHLYFHPDADHIRLLQGGMAIKYIQKVYQNLIEKYGDENVTIIFSGDFNSDPASGIYKLYTTGNVGSDLIDWKSNEEEAVKDLSLDQPFSLASACGTPQYTNYTSLFAECLDYIFYEKNKMDVAQVVPLPANEELTQFTALPSVVFPSDHVSLVADLRWK